MKLLIQFPTFARAEKFLHVLAVYVETVSTHNELFFNINCDLSDLSMTDGYVQERIKYILNKKPNVDGIQNFDSNTEKISAINDHMEGMDFDIVVSASDDMVPKAWGWDNEIAVAMKEHFPELDGCVSFYDGVREKFQKDNLITFSILGKNFCYSY